MDKQMTVGGMAFTKRKDGTFFQCCENFDEPMERRVMNETAAIIDEVAAMRERFDKLEAVMAMNKREENGRTTN
jgi:hypothetical protein